MNDRIKFSGHTMGAPKCDIFEVIELFKSIGYDGIEVRVAADGQIDSRSLRMRRRARSMPQPGQREWSFPA